MVLVMLRHGIKETKKQGKMNNSPSISIITPTYNRGLLLKRCYDSLNTQTSKDFEWIIVDDGSEDNTEEIVSTFEADYCIKYIKKKNGGKHTALNASHPYIRGKYVVILDSDDYFVPDAVEIIIKEWDDFKNIEAIGIVTFLKGQSVGKPFCYGKYERIPVDIMPSDRVIIQTCDCCEVIKASLFKKYPFPEFRGERFISESVLWNKVGFTHKCVYINEVIYLADYLESGLTKSGRKFRIQNPKGGMYSSRLNMQKKNYLCARIKSALLYTCYGFFAEMPFYKIITTNPYKLLTALCMFPGWLLFLYWKKKYL